MQKDSDTERHTDKESDGDRDLQRERQGEIETQQHRDGGRGVPEITRQSGDRQVKKVDIKRP